MTSEGFLKSYLEMLIPLTEGNSFSIKKIIIIQRLLNYDFFLRKLKKVLNLKVTLELLLAIKKNDV